MTGAPDIVYVIHGSNAHTWWRRLANGGYAWWKRWSLFCWELRRAFVQPCNIREFRWSGANNHQARMDAGAELARVVSAVTPGRRIHLVGHSHGANVALTAVNLLPPQRVESVIALANPNISGAHGWLYWGKAPGLVPRIWNLYSPEDVVQCRVVQRFHGVPQAVCPSLKVSALFGGNDADRIHNGEIHWSGWLAAHRAMHSSQMGTVVGCLLRGSSFQDALNSANLKMSVANPVRDRGGWPGMQRAQDMIRSLGDPSPFDIGDRSGSVGLLFIHGFTASPAEMRPMAEFIANAERWRCIAPLLPGHGTRIEDQRKATAADWLNAVEESYEGLARDCTRVVLVGLSAGAVLACHAALRRLGDSKLRGVILLAPAFGVNAWRAAMIRVLGPFGYNRGKGKPAVDYFLDHRLMTYVATPLDRAADVIRLGSEAMRNMHRLKELPVMMVVGDRESTVSLEKMLTVAKKNPWIQLVRLPRSRHIVTVEPDRQLLFESSVRFVKECCGL